MCLFKRKKKSVGYYESANKKECKSETSVTLYSHFMKLRYCSYENIKIFYYLMTVNTSTSIIKFDALVLLSLFSISIVACSLCVTCQLASKYSLTPEVIYICIPQDSSREFDYFFLIPTNH